MTTSSQMVQRRGTSPRLTGLLFSLACAMTLQGGVALYAQQDTTCWQTIVARRMLKATSSPRDSAMVRSNLFECTNMADQKIRDGTLSFTDSEAVRLTKMFFDIPEYHDEGRLAGGRDANGDILGPIAAIFASPFLGGINRPGQIYEQAFPGTLAAIVVVQPKSGEVVPASYGALHLRKGINCIWLYLPPPPGGAKRYVQAVSNLPFSAYVTHHPTVAACRKSWMGNTLASTSQEFLIGVEGPLAVIPVQHPDFRQPTDYPAAARFDTDANGNPILGFKCLDAFCEVHPVAPNTPNLWKRVRMPSGLTAAAANPLNWVAANAAARSPAARVQVIKGWHDEQILAIRDAAGVWRPSGIRATIIPNADAASYDSSSFDHTWVKVATIVISNLPDTSKYHRVWRLNNGPNELFYQYDGATWRAQLGQGEGAHPWHLIERVRHFDAAVPPTARFRWTTLDDGVWAPCGEACCKAGES